MDEVRAHGPRFACTRCGDCCTGAQIIRLTLGDLELLAGHLKLKTVADLRALGLVALVREPAGQGKSFWRPRIRFRSRPLAQCPFLVNDVDEKNRYHGLCSLHPDAKPLVCRLSPLSREVDDPGAGPVVETWSFVPPVDGCPGAGRGKALPLKAPASLKVRLAAEIEDLRRWMAQGADCPDEQTAWERLASKKEGP